MKNSFTKNVSRYLLICLGVSLSLFSFSQSITYTTSTGSSNPRYSEKASETFPVNTEPDNYLTGWTQISGIAGSNSSNVWSNTVDFSTISSTYTFKYFGSSVSTFRVSCNGLLMFGSGILPSPSSTSDNESFPTSNVPNKTIAGFWDNFNGYKATSGSTTSTACTTGSDDIVYYKLIGTYPYRQLWIKWSNFRIGAAVGTDCSAAIPDNAYFSIVLEESTNKIYLVDQYRGTNYANGSATWAVQNSSSSGVNYTSNRQLSSASFSTYADNSYVCFNPIENTVTLSTLTFSGEGTASTNLYAGSNVSASSGTQTLSLPSTSSQILNKNISNATLYVNFNTGEDNNCGSYTGNFTVKVRARATLADATTMYLIGDGTTANDKLLTLNATTPEVLKVCDITSYYNTSSSNPITSIQVWIYLYNKPASNPACSSDVRLKAWVEESYSVNVNTSPYDSYPLIYNLSASTLSSYANPVTFSWSSYGQYVPQYQLQVLRLYNTNTAYTTTYGCQASIDWNKALTYDVTGGATNVTLFMAEGTGYYVWRVRPIGSYYSGGAANSLNWGSWNYPGTWAGSSSNPTSIDLNGSGSPVSGYADVFYLNQTESSKNWIYNRMFSESNTASGNNGIAEGIVFATGLGMKKQVQSKIQSSTSSYKFLMNQSVYDYSGRNALNSLAVPVSSTSYFTYYNQLLRNGSSPYTASAFDANSNYTAPTTASSSVLNDYYSDNTSLQPDATIQGADNYPFSRTLFYQDGTNRPKEVSGPGNTFRLGGSRTTKFYMQGVSDDELIHMFGNEAPLDTQVTKLITVDPNQVTTVTYVKNDGKTIATCYSGNPSSPLQSVSYSTTAVNIADTVNGNFTLNDNAYCKETSLLVTSSPSLSLNYILHPNQISESCGASYCSTCDYTIQIYIKNVETGTIVWGVSQLIPSTTTCADYKWIYNSSTNTWTNNGSTASGTTWINNGTSSSTAVAFPSTSLSSGNYVIGRCVTTNNTNSSTALSYQQEMLASLTSNIDYENNNVSGTLGWDNFYSDYAAGNCSTVGNFYTRLESNLGVTIDRNAAEFTINTGSNSCCSVTLPVLNCDETPPTSFEDWTRSQLGTAGYGYYPLNWFKNYSSLIYYTFSGTYNPSWGTTIFNNDGTDDSGSSSAWLTFGPGTGSTSMSHLKFKIDNETIIDADLGYYGTEANGLNYRNSAYTMINNYFTAKYGSNTAYWPYTFTSVAFPYTGADSRNYYVITIASNVPYGGKVDASIYANPSYYYKDETQQVFTSIVQPISLGYLDNLITNMVADGYDRTTLWKIWKSLIAKYPSSQGRGSNVKPYDLLQDFLTQASTKRNNIFSISNYNSGYRARDWFLQCYKSVPIVANMVIINSGYFINCTNYWGVNITNDSTADGTVNYLDIKLITGGTLKTVKNSTTYSTAYKDSVFNNFYGCLLSGWQFVNGSSADPKDLLNLTSYCGTADYNCVNAMARSAEDTCIVLCRLRMEEAMVEAQQVYKSMGITPTNLQLECAARKIKEYCASNCDIYPLDYTYSGSVQVPTPPTTTQQNNFKKAITYEMDMVPCTSGTCSGLTGYETLSSSEMYSAILADELNERLYYYYLAGNTSITRTTIAGWISAINTSYNLSDIIPTGCNLPTLSGTATYGLNGTSAFSIVGTSSNPVLRLTYDPALTVDLYTWPSGCDFSIDCTIYFKWKAPSFTPQTTITLKTCDQMSTEYLMASIDKQLSECKQAKLNTLKNAYQTTCAKVNSLKDTLVFNYSNAYHHFTLFYYDRAGNLVKTVPPKGVSDYNASHTSAAYHNSYGQPTSRRAIPAYNTTSNYATEYIYDSFNRLTQKITPDGGSTYYYYNSLGQLRFSQNAKQLADGKYAYIKYDALGRAIETGLSTYNASTFTSYLDNSSFPNPTTTGYNVEITNTVYTSSASVTYITGGSQSYLQNRVSYAYTDADGSYASYLSTPTTNGDEVYTYFSYDPHGNVQWLIQSIPGMGGNQYLKYEYDLISNRVTKVIYNEGRTDQVYHRYGYDADGRVTKVETSTNGKIWDKDAQYDYYDHGPLKRIKIGEDKIQGLDYVYTLQGWLKAVNHPSMSTTNDPGQDNGTANPTFAKDAFSEMLSYYNGDFNRTGSVFNDATAVASSYTATAVSGYGSLYNGMIAAQMSNNSLPSSTANYYKGSAAFVNLYTYDQLGRYVNQAVQYFNSTSSNWDSFGSGNDYSEQVAYNDNGGITSYLRKGFGLAPTTSGGNFRGTYAASATALDNLTYNYTANTNKLSYVSDAVPSTMNPGYTTDLETQTSGNYSYDQAGHLSGDVSGYNGKTISITWGANDKVKNVQVGSGSGSWTLDYLYDAMGNRVKKTNTAYGSSTPTYTYYVTDAAGREMAMYSASGTGTPQQVEAPIYAGSRLGAFATNNNANSTFSVSDNTYSRTVCGTTEYTRKYELKDHLGNVRVVVNDAKNVSGSTYSPNIISATDYYPYGMNMPGRDYQGTNSKIGYQGKLKEDDIYGNANAYDFGARILDNRLGRWHNLNNVVEDLSIEINRAEMENKIQKVKINKKDTKKRFRLFYKIKSRK